MNQSLRALSNEMLMELLDKRVEFETWNEAEMIDSLREVLRRKLWLKFGADSMYDFMTHAHFHLEIGRPSAEAGWPAGPHS